MISRSKLQTQKFAIRLVRKILKANRLERSRRATVIALSGDLGSGKTAFAQGFIKALGSKERVVSPTFIIFRKHSFLDKKVFHFDLYRIKRAKELFGLGFKKIIKDSANIVLIEWPELIKKSLPKNTIWIKFEHGKTRKERIITVR